MTKMIFTMEQVEKLNEYQASPYVHPFTCPHRDNPDHAKHAYETNARDIGILIAQTDGWHCKVPGCDHRQYWAHTHMFDGAPPMPDFLAQRQEQEGLERPQRRAIYELIAIALAGFGLAFAVPTLISAHDSVALLAAALLTFGWAGWLAYFVYRSHQKGV